MQNQTEKTPDNADYRYDTLIKNATVFDGSGSEGEIKDVAIKGDKIVALGKLENELAIDIIDAEGLTLAPGFIDVHTHDDLEIIRNPQMLNKISQGVTSVIIGNCGISASPYASDKEPVDPINLLGKKAEFVFPELAHFVEKVAQVKPNVNVAALVGHTSLRAQVMDTLDRPATSEEIEKMVLLLNQALEQGAKGLSSGLAYHNAHAAPSEEVQALVQHLKTYDAIYTTHLRTEFDGIIDALDEAFITAKQGKVPLIISHLKCAGKANWGRAPEVLAHINNHQSSQKISCDCYPYSASSSTLDLKQVTNDFSIFITWSEPHPDMAGQTLASIAEQWQTSLEVAAKRLQPAGAVYHGIAEQDVRQILKFPSTMVGSDGLPCDPHPHPRLWSTFPRVLGHYCREKQILELSQAIHKMTGLSATNFKLTQRGFIRPNYYADLVLFDDKTVEDVADFVTPIAISKGIMTVWVNGQKSYQSGDEHGDAAFVSTEGAGRFLTHTCDSRKSEVNYDN